MKRSVILSVVMIFYGMSSFASQPAANTACSDANRYQSCFVNYSHSGSYVIQGLACGVAKNHFERVARENPRKGDKLAFLEIVSGTGTNTQTFVCMKKVQCCQAAQLVAQALKKASESN